MGELDRPFLVSTEEAGVEECGDNRFALNTFQGNSGEAKAIRASFPARRLFRMRAAYSIVEASDRTSSTTVFTIPPRDVRIEVGQHLVR